MLRKAPNSLYNQYNEDDIYFPQIPLKSTGLACVNTKIKILNFLIVNKKEHLLFTFLNEDLENSTNITE